jgi:hypothetical protein
VLFLIHKKSQIEQALSLPRESENGWQTEHTSFSWGSPGLVAEGDQVLMVTF